MKNISTYIILGLIVIIILLWLFPSHSPRVVDIRSKIDSAIRPHKIAAMRLETKANELREKIQTDSVKSKAEKVVYETKIAFLKKKLKEIKYVGNPSIVPDDSVTLSMQAMKESPVKDSIITTLESRVVKLEQEKKEVEDIYKELVKTEDNKCGELQAIIDLKDDEITELGKYLKRLKRNNVKSAIGGALIGFGLGAIVK